MGDLTLAIVAAVALIIAAAFTRWWLLPHRQSLGTAADRATQATLHAASLVLEKARFGDRLRVVREALAGRTTSASVGLSNAGGLLSRA